MIRLYEGMFLFPQAATGDLGSATDHVRDLLGRIDAEIVSLVKWDERRLAYEIKGNKRGLYLLCYFRADGDRLTELERASNLSEHLLRSMVTRAEHVTDEDAANASGEQALADEIALKGTEPEPEPAASGEPG